jgi:hypothetical protein
MIEERDLRIRMRDGVRLALDVYRPDGKGPFPVLYAAALHNKDLQGPDMADVLPNQPANVPLWFGPIEAGDSRRPWCDGNVGMVGISGYAGVQWRAAAQGHPALKAIFPYDACSAYGGIFGYRDFYPGGVLHTFPYLLDVFSTVHEQRGVPGELPPEDEAFFTAAMANPDFKMYVNLYNILTQKGKRTFIMFHSMVTPWEPEGTVEAAEDLFKKIKIPYYTGSGAYAYTYKLHWLGAEHYFQNARNAPRKLIFTGPAHLERPFHQYHDEIIRRYDHWLKGVENGIMDEPPVRYWLVGANEWRTAADWPLPETEWRRLYLRNWERLTSSPPRPVAETGLAAREPDVFTQMPLKQTTKVERLRYMTEPFSEDLTVVGPISLTLYAAIDKTDTNWSIVLKDVGPDVSAVTARSGERSVPSNLPERELTRGWLKASYRAIDPSRSKPDEPFHKLTRRSGPVRSLNIKSTSSRPPISSRRVTGFASKSPRWTCLRGPAP